MKKLLIYLSILIAITGILILSVSKNYPENILEVCLKSYASPQQVSNAIKTIGSFDYFNVYEIFSTEDAISVYTGNVNLFLYDKDYQDIELTLDDSEVLMGDKYMYKHLKYDALGGKYKSEFGEYYVNCVLENNDRIYYRDIKILESSRIKNQKIYVSLLNNKNILMNPQNKLVELQGSGIMYGKSIAYLDVNNILKQLLVLLLIIFDLLVLITLNKSNRKIRERIKGLYRDTKYDLELSQFLFKKENFKIIIKYVLYILLQLVSVGTIVFLVAKFMSIPVSYSVDIRSLKSIISLIKSFVDLLKYYYLNGFTAISFMIVKIIMIYSLVTVLYLFACCKIESKKLSKTK